MVFTHDEIKFLYSKADDEIMATHLLILIYTGMRINEYLSLELKDYDVKEFTIRTGSKTEAGKNRLIPIHSKIRSLLYKVLSEEENKISYAIFRNQFTKYLKKYDELGEHTIHDTRHTFASMLSTAGANDVAITKIIGHTDIATTNKIYTHKDIFELRQAVELLQ
ncbi:tyrosine-type recombinase/integrase [uncultured Fusobacterium sp.]|uniref:tyrosine-type recombinase/integrase n=1 Tax=uncultured Fusobacterium sp. TaxID=159267 RepID=UPI0025F6A355|nr:tyrosine-type recombinase/integrase [uncultured Fusobacterium sp.]